MKSYLLLAVFFITTIFTNVHPKYECLAVGTPIALLFGLFGTSISDGKRIINEANKIMNCDPIKDYEYIKDYCSTTKDLICPNVVAYDLYVQCINAKNDKEKLKSITYFIGKNLKDRGENLVEFGKMSYGIAISVILSAVILEKYS